MHPNHGVQNAHLKPSTPALSGRRHWPGSSIRARDRNPGSHPDRAAQCGARHVHDLPPGAIGRATRALGHRVTRGQPHEEVSQRAEVKRERQEERQRAIQAPRYARCARCKSNLNVHDNTRPACCFHPGKLVHLKHWPSLSYVLDLSFIWEASESQSPC